MHSSLYLPLIVVDFICFPSFDLVEWIAPQIGIKHKKSPLGTFASVFVVFLLVFMKVIGWQFCFNAASFVYIGEDYVSAIPLAYLARHWKCNMCLMEDSMLSAVKHGEEAELKLLAWLQFYSMF